MALSTIFKGGIIAMVLVIGIGMIQLFQFMGNVHDARETALNEWAVDNTEKESLVKQYREACRSEPKSSTDVQNQLVSIHECAVKHGSNEIASIIQAAEDTVNLPAPLRWL